MSTDKFPFEEAKVEAREAGKDPRTRRILVALGVLWLITLLILFGVSWNAYFDEKAKSETLAQQISNACESGSFGPGVSAEDEKKLCDDAEKVIEQNDIEPENIAGPPGPPGEDGTNGVSGTDGSPGKTGKPGQPGKPGDKGRAGLDGSEGDNGSDGAQGPVGPEGPVGSQGEVGPEGPRGPSGVVNVTTVDCEGPVITSISASYDADTNTVIITCT